MFCVVHRKNKPSYLLIAPFRPTSPHHTTPTTPTTAKDAGIKPRALSKAQLIEALETAHSTPPKPPTPIPTTTSSSQQQQYIRPQQRQRARAARGADTTPLNPGTVRRRKGLPRLHTLVTADLRENFGA